MAKKNERASVSQRHESTVQTHSATSRERAEEERVAQVNKTGLTLQYNLACYTCLLGNVEEARKLIEEAIELGGDAMRLRALDDEHLIRVWAGP